MLENEQIPKELEPENIKLMLDQKAPAMKRKKISAVSRFAAIAAACAVVSGTAVHFASNGDIMKKSSSSKGDSKVVSTNQNGTEPSPEANERVEQAPYMSGAKDYSEIYTMFSNGADALKKQYYKGRNDSRYTEMTEESDAVSNGAKSADEAFIEPIGGKGGGGDFSTTFNQEENVLEADIVKTDGKRIYSVHNYGKNAVLHITDADNGELGNLFTVNLTEDMSDLLGDEYINKSGSVNEMYIYDDMVIVIGGIYGSKKDAYVKEYNWYLNSKNLTYVAAYSLDDSHKCLGVYCQDGYYSDVRISPEGYMYLITNHSSNNFITVEEDNIESYIPSAGMSDNIKCIAPENIYMPADNETPCRNLIYSVIGSIDLNESEKMNPVETKALAGTGSDYGYCAQIYCAPDNLYAVSSKYFNYMPEEDVEYGHRETVVNSSYITRIAIEEGEITPVASTEVEGNVNDQFSMSEYEDTFRIATTRYTNSYVYTKGEYYDYGDVYEESEYEEADEEELSETIDFDSEEFSSETTTTKENEPKIVEYGYYEYDGESSKHDNVLYVLDLDLKQIGYIDDFGINEDIQSVTFGGDKAYVTTFRRTDPLYAIDLSDPASPSILSEYKMNGFSSYMQQWGDGELLGFGPNADDEGSTNGIKLTMFDNSDPDELKAIDTYVEEWDTIDDTYYNSSAVWERKALLIDPKKNIIAYPVEETIYNSVYKTQYRLRYRFLRFEDGKFKEIGTLYNDTNNNDDDAYYYSRDERAIYIGDYVYIISDNGITSADIDTITTKDKVTFTEEYEYDYEEDYYCE